MTAYTVLRVCVRATKRSSTITGSRLPASWPVTRSSGWPPSAVRSKSLRVWGQRGFALLEFPTLAAARAWYTIRAYQKASEHRLRGGDYSAMIVDGAASERLLAPWRPAASGESVQASL